MSSIIVNPKNYTGHDLDNIFFRPLLTGPSAESLGIRILYNMPMPTTVHVWSRPDNVLQPFASGWDGGESATKYQKTINMRKVKAETQFSADDYFSLVFEKIVGSSDVSYQDLTGTELEKAETELFRQAIVEGIRSTMWIGDISGIVSDTTTFNGFFRQILNRVMLIIENLYLHRQLHCATNVIPLSITHRHSRRNVRRQA